ncbi:MAG TPA: peptidylprolyl isomerase [Verrucomicrobiae bacterium]|jgi:peptidyl-prolyl cis-trans isomerase C|nr:peptidylprolyl isomerase [Verrucomicrobiae bacterium]
MKSNSKFLGVLLAASVLSTAALKADDKPATTNAPAAAGAKLDDLFPDPVIAKGTGFEIKRSQLDEAISGVRSAAAARGRELTPADLSAIERSSFDHLLEVQLLKAKATADDKAKATVEADKRFAIIKKRAPSQEALDRQLKVMNLTEETLRGRLIEEATAEQVLRDKVKVTDDQVRKYYDDNPSQFEEPEMVDASHILLMTVDPKTGKALPDDEKKAKLKQAEDLLKRAKGGEDFAKLASQYSEDPGSKENGGKYVFPRGRMVKEFEAAAFTLQTNQISDIVTTQYGYHIIKLNEKIPAKKLEFDKVKTDVRTALESQAMEKILPDVTDKLKKDANVQILDAELKTLMETKTEMPGAPGALPSSLPPQTK